MGSAKYKQKHFAFEHRNERPLPTHEFVGRLARYSLGATFLVIFALGVGILGYHRLVDLSWTDSFLNASMILSGMGPVNEIRTESGKIFAGIYALFSGLIFIAAVSLVIAPLFHRILHRFHFEEDQSGDQV
jgi:hypothetical protein